MYPIILRLLSQRTLWKRWQRHCATATALWQTLHMKYLPTRLHFAMQTGSGYEVIVAGQPGALRMQRLRQQFRCQCRPWFYTASPTTQPATLRIQGYGAFPLVKAPPPPSNEALVPESDTIQYVGLKHPISIRLKNRCQKIPSSAPSSSFTIPYIVQIHDTVLLPSLSPIKPSERPRISSSAKTRRLSCHFSSGIRCNFVPRKVSAFHTMRYFEAARLIFIWTLAMVALERVLWRTPRAKRSLCLKRWERSRRLCLISWRAS